MVTSDKYWFTYEPIPHSDNGLIYCDGPTTFIAKVTRTGNGKEFTIEFDGTMNEQIESILKQMRDWFFHTHIKDAEDNEF